MYAADHYLSKIRPDIGALYKSEYSVFNDIFGNWFGAFPSKQRSDPMIDHTSNSAASFSPSRQLHQDGYVLLRAAVPLQWLDELRIVFDTGLKPNDQWPVPRGVGWQHSLLDLSPIIQSVCRLPAVLAAVGTLIGERFFLSQVEGREPLLNGGHQGLHRDLSAQRPGDTVLAIVFLDDYGPGNGATRIVPRSHRQAQVDLNNASLAVQLSGSAGDILVFEADLVHAGSLNITGARRRSLLISYLAEPLYASHLKTVHLRNIRMETAWFDPEKP